MRGVPDPATPCVVHRPATWTSPEHWLEMQNLGPTPDLLSENLLLTGPAGDRWAHSSLRSIGLELSVALGVRSLGICSKRVRLWSGQPWAGSSLPVGLSFFLSERRRLEWCRCSLLCPSWAPLFFWVCATVNITFLTHQTKLCLGLRRTGRCIRELTLTLGSGISRMSLHCPQRRCSFLLAVRHKYAKSIRWRDIVLPSLCAHTITHLPCAGRGLLSGAACVVWLLYRPSSHHLLPGPL